MKKIIAVIILIVLSLGVFSSCENNNGNTFYTCDYFNTTITFASYDATAPADWEEIKKILKKVDNAISTTKDSDIKKCNQTSYGRIEIQKTTFDLLIICQSFYKKTEGVFNPCLGLVVDLWGFSPRFRANTNILYPYDRIDFTNELPEKKYLDAFEELSDFSYFSLEENNGKYYIIKEKKEIEIDGITYTPQLDLSGVGKGYAGDLIYEYFSSCESVKNYYISIGTSTLLLGKNKNKDWSIGIKNPRNEGNFATFDGKNTTVSTSGDYESYYEYEGIRYCHIFDGKTRKSKNNNIISVTLTGKSATECDILTTYLCTLTEKEAIKYCEENLTNDFVCIVYADNDSYKIYSNNQNNFQITGQIQ